MAVKRGGLGKGLDSLIPQSKHVNTTEKPVVKTDDVEKQAPKVEIVEKIVEKVVEKVVKSEEMVRISKIEPNREQPRKNFEEDALLELADSIKQFGLIQPLIVQKKNDYYEIIAGERRWRAAKLAGLKEVPVIVKEYSKQEAMEIALIENIQREDLNPIEEALALSISLLNFL